MKRLLVICALVGVALAGCGKDDDTPDVAAATTTTSGVASATAPSTTTTAAVKVTTTTTNAGNPPGLVPADAQSPAAGGCGNATNGIAEVALNPDVPSPRCIIVHDTDHLRVKNNFAFAVRVDDGGGSFTVQPGASETGMKALGGYWATGVHRLKIFNAATNAALYGGSGPEIWLQ
jgi:hypothetical protein